MDSFLGFIPGSVGETSALMCLIGAALLLWTGIASWRVISSFFVGGFVMATILNLIGGNGYFELPAIHQPMFLEDLCLVWFLWPLTPLLLLIPMLVNLFMVF